MNNDKDKKILGSYNSVEGIYLDLENNLENNLGISTAIHETYHRILESATSLGFVKRLFDLENKRSDDSRYKAKMKVLSDIILRHMSFVQEVFANNIEILKIEEMHGKEQALNLYNLKPLDYQNCYKALNVINSNKELSFKKKYELIFIVCAYSLNPDIRSNEFLNSFLLPQKVNKFLNDKENKPIERLRFILDNLESEESIGSYFENYIGTFCESLLNKDKENLIKYSFDFLSETLACIQSWNSGEREFLSECIAQFDLLTYRNLKVFNLKVEKSEYLDDRSFFSLTDLYFLIIKEFQVGQSDFSDKDDYLFISKCSNAGKFIATKGQSYLIDKIVNKNNIRYVLIKGNEYNLQKETHSTYKFNEIKPLIVLIEEYDTCIDIISYIYRESHIIYSIQNLNADFSILFFKLERQNLVFVFLTLKRAVDEIEKFIHRGSCNSKIFHYPDNNFYENIKELSELALDFFMHMSGDR